MDRNVYNTPLGVDSGIAGIGVTAIPLKAKFPVAPRPATARNRSNSNRNSTLHQRSSSSSSTAVPTARVQRVLQKAQNSIDAYDAVPFDLSKPLTRPSTAHAASSSTPQSTSYRVTLDPNQTNAGMRAANTVSLLIPGNQLNLTTAFGRKSLRPAPSSSTSTSVSRPRSAAMFSTFHRPQEPPHPEWQRLAHDGEAAIEVGMATSPSARALLTANPPPLPISSHPSHHHLMPNNQQTPQNPWWNLYHFVKEPAFRFVNLHATNNIISKGGIVSNSNIQLCFVLSTSGFEITQPEWNDDADDDQLEDGSEANDGDGEDDDNTSTITGLSSRDEEKQASTVRDEPGRNESEWVEYSSRDGSKVRFRKVVEEGEKKFAHKPRGMKAKLKRNHVSVPTNPADINPTLTLTFQTHLPPLFSLVDDVSFVGDSSICPSTEGLIHTVALQYRKLMDRNSVKVGDIRLLRFALESVLYSLEHAERYLKKMEWSLHYIAVTTRGPLLVMIGSYQDVHIVVSASARMEHERQKQAAASINMQEDPASQLAAALDLRVNSPPPSAWLMQKSKLYILHLPLDLAIYALRIAADKLSPLPPGLGDSVQELLQRWENHPKYQHTMDGVNAQNEEMKKHGNSRPTSSTGHRTRSSSPSRQARSNDNKERPYSTSAVREAAALRESDKDLSLAFVKDDTEEGTNEWDQDIAETQSSARRRVQSAAPSSTAATNARNIQSAKRPGSATMRVPSSSVAGTSSAPRDSLPPSASGSSATDTSTTATAAQMMVGYFGQQTPLHAVSVDLTEALANIPASGSSSQYSTARPSSARAYAKKNPKRLSDQELHELHPSAGGITTHPSYVSEQLIRDSYFEKQRQVVKAVELAPPPTWGEGDDGGKNSARNGGNNVSNSGGGIAVFVRVGEAAIKHHPSASSSSSSSRRHDSATRRRSGSVSPRKSNNNNSTTNASSSTSSVAPSATSTTNNSRPSTARATRPSSAAPSRSSFRGDVESGLATAIADAAAAAAAAADNENSAPEARARTPSPVLSFFGSAGVASHLHESPASKRSSINNTNTTTSSNNSRPASAARFRPNSVEAPPQGSTSSPPTSARKRLPQSASAVVRPQSAQKKQPAQVSAQRATALEDLSDIPRNTGPFFVEVASDTSASPDTASLQQSPSHRLRTSESESEFSHTPAPTTAAASPRARPQSAYISRSSAAATAAARTPDGSAAGSPHAKNRPVSAMRAKDAEKMQQQEAPFCDDGSQSSSRPLSSHAPANQTTNTISAQDLESKYDEGDEGDEDEHQLGNRHVSTSLHAPTSHDGLMLDESAPLTVRDPPAYAGNMIPVLATQELFDIQVAQVQQQQFAQKPHRPMAFTEIVSARDPDEGRSHLPPANSVVTFPPQHPLSHNQPVSIDKLQAEGVDLFNTKCTLQSCQNKLYAVGGLGYELFRCVWCGSAIYCSSGCMVEDWLSGVHQRVCAEEQARLRATQQIMEGGNTHRVNQGQGWMEVIAAPMPLSPHSQRARTPNRARSSSPPRSPARGGEITDVAAPISPSSASSSHGLDSPSRSQQQRERVVYEEVNMDDFDEMQPSAAVFDSHYMSQADEEFLERQAVREAEAIEAAQAPNSLQAAMQALSNFPQQPVFHIRTNPGTRPSSANPMRPQTVTDFVLARESEEYRITNTSAAAAAAALNSNNAYIPQVAVPTAKRHDVYQLEQQRAYALLYDELRGAAAPASQQQHQQKQQKAHQRPASAHPRSGNPNAVAAPQDASLLLQRLQQRLNGALSSSDKARAGLTKDLHPTAATYEPPIGKRAVGGFQLAHSTQVGGGGMAALHSSRPISALSLQQQQQPVTSAALHYVPLSDASVVYAKSRHSHLRPSSASSVQARTGVNNTGNRKDRSSTSTAFSRGLAAPSFFGPKLDLFMKLTQAQPQTSHHQSAAMSQPQEQTLSVIPQVDLKRAIASARPRSARLASNGRSAMPI